MVCMQIASETVDALKNAAKKLSGSEKRKFMAGIVIALGRGAQRAVSRQLNWCRSTIIRNRNIEGDNMQITSYDKYNYHS